MKTLLANLQLPPYWKLAVVRCAIYAGMAGGQTYMAGVEGYQDWSDLSPMARQKLALNVVLAIASTWAAFLDQTITKMGGSTLLTPGGSASPGVSLAEPLTPEKSRAVLADMTLRA